MTPVATAHAERARAREELSALVRRERFLRDQRRFDELGACYVSGGRVRTSWYDGATESYAAACRARWNASVLSKHWVSPCNVEVNGNRATVESTGLIANRFDLDGVEVDLDAYCRFFSRAERQGSEWLLASFEVIWERDQLRTVHQGEPLPVDRAAVAHFRSSYRFLSFMQARRGTQVDQELLGDDCPEGLLAFYAEQDRWLAQGG